MEPVTKDDYRNVPVVLGLGDVRAILSSLNPEGAEEYLRWRAIAEFMSDMDDPTGTVSISVNAEQLGFIALIADSLVIDYKHLRPSGESVWDASEERKGCDDCGLALRRCLGDPDIWLHPDGQSACPEHPERYPDFNPF